MNETESDSLSEIKCKPCDSCSLMATLEFILFKYAYTVDRVNYRLKKYFFFFLKHRLLFFGLPCPLLVLPNKNLVCLFAFCQREVLEPVLVWPTNTTQLTVTESTEWMTQQAVSSIQNIKMSKAKRRVYSKWVIQDVQRSVICSPLSSAYSWQFVTVWEQSKESTDPHLN